ncbi:hypothetical protein TKK_0010020 [Trichogramma kaykai]
MERILNGVSRNLTFQDAQSTSASLNYQVMPDLSKSIPVFTGSEAPAVAREWIENIRSMRVLHNWPEALALETARIHLAQGARDWFSARLASLDTWPKFSAAFESAVDRAVTAERRTYSSVLAQQSQTVLKFEPGRCGNY